jgi:hypothetical protein
MNDIKYIEMIKDCGLYGNDHLGDMLELCYQVAADERAEGAKFLADMTDRELMQMALDAMESFDSGTNGLDEGEFAEECNALRDRLAQPERKWVGFTHEELAWLNEALNLGGRFAVIEAIEAKLKGKNHG